VYIRLRIFLPANFANGEGAAGDPGKSAAEKQFRGPAGGTLNSALGIAAVTFLFPQGSKKV